MAPLEQQFGIEAVHVTTMQPSAGRLCGRGVVRDPRQRDPLHIGGGEEEKIETEPRKILGGWSDNRFTDAPMKISAQVNRVPPSTVT